MANPVRRSPPLLARHLCQRLGKVGESHGRWQFSVRSTDGGKFPGIRFFSKWSRLHHLDEGTDGGTILTTPQTI